MKEVLSFILEVLAVGVVAALLFSLPIGSTGEFE